MPETNEKPEVAVKPVAPKTDPELEKRKKLAEPEILRLQAEYEKLKAEYSRVLEFEGWVNHDLLNALKATEGEIKVLNCFIKYPLPWTLTDLGKEAYHAVMIEGGFMETVPSLQAFRGDLSPTSTVVALHNKLA